MIFKYPLSDPMDCPIGATMRKEQKLHMAFATKVLLVEVKALAAICFVTTVPEADPDGVAF